MSAVDTPLEPSSLPVQTAEERAALPPQRVIADIALVAQRNLRKIPRNPRLILFTTIQPVLQLVLFVFVFGAIATVAGGDVSYKEFVVPAVLIQSVTFAAMTSGIGIANDLHTGMVDRLRSLPIARSAFLVGRTTSDSTRLGIQSVLLVFVALLIGFRFQNGFVPAVGMIVVVVLWGVALTTFSAWVGLAVREPDAVQAAVFIPMLPLVFTSSAFAPVSELPGWMQPLAAINPVTAAINLTRGLALGNDALMAVSNMTITTAAIHFGLWWVAIVGISTALAVRRYRLG